MRPSLRTAQNLARNATESAGARALRNPSTARAVLLEVPSTSTPRDVLRALRDSGAVDDRMGLSALTPLPVGAAREALVTTYHIEAGTDALTLASRLAARPLFHGAGRAATPTGGRPSRGRADPDTGGIREASAVTTTHYAAHDWARMLLQKAANSSWAKLRPVAPIPTGWAIDPALSGRRVIVHGLPGRVPPDHVAALGGDVGIVKDGENAPRAHPPSPWALSSSWIITADSVAEAHALVRQLNMNYFRRSSYNKQFLMRASVVW